MDTFWVYAKHEEKVGEVRELAESLGFVADAEQPDFIISLGGDGTFLICERECPGVPKLPVRDSMICFKCHDEPLDAALQMIRRRDHRIEEHIKLWAVCQEKRLLAANDVVVRNKDPRHALRFRLAVDGESLDDLFIGDGVVVATPFGATGYYGSVTGETFEQGIGLAFNNPTDGREPIHLSADAEVVPEVVRSDAHLAVDNNPDLTVVGEGDTVTVSRADEVVRLIGHD